mgnify:FL=1
MQEFYEDEFPTTDQDVKDARAAEVFEAGNYRGQIVKIDGRTDDKRKDYPLYEHQYSHFQVKMFLNERTPAFFFDATPIKLKWATGGYIREYVNWTKLVEGTGTQGKAANEVLSAVEGAMLVFTLGYQPAGVSKKGKAFEESNSIKKIQVYEQEG